MDELITKWDAIEAVNDVLAECIPTLRPWQSKIPLACALKIKALPAVQPKRGKWKPRYYDVGADTYVEWACSECGYVRQKGREDGDAGEEPEADFCEKCGAKMER